MNKILHLFYVVCILSASVNTASNSTTALSQLTRVAEIGNELMYELMEVDGKKSANNVKLRWNAEYITCKDLDFCRGHEDCNQYSKEECSGPFWNKKCKTIHYYKGDCTNKHWYIVDYTQKGEFKRNGELYLGYFNTAKLVAKTDSSFVMTFSGDISYYGNFNIKRSFKEYSKDDHFSFSDKLNVTIIVKFIQNNKGGWVAELNKLSVNNDLYSYSPSIESRLKTKARE